jgi:FkbM family methyltransferase
MSNTYYGQLKLDQVIHETFFPDKKKGFFVECGAHDGLMESTCKFFEESMEWKGLNIEPVPYTFEKLIKNRPKSINENVALSSKKGIATFTNAIHPIHGRLFGNGSLKHVESHMKELLENGCEIETFEVQTIVFSELATKHVIPEIDLFVLDVEGHEEDALSGILTTPAAILPKVFCIEHTITGLDKIKGMLAKTHNFHSTHYQNAFFLKKTDNDPHL